MKIYIAFLLMCVSYTAHSQIQCTVDVTINEGTSIEMCKSALVPITASAGFANYAWTGPEMGAGQSFSPTVSGQFVVAAMDGLGCISTDTIQVMVHEPPVDAIISSAGDTLCSAGSTTLSLSGAYLLYDWGGANTSPTLTVSSTGTYSVDVADANSCVTTFTYDFTILDFSIDSTYGNDCTGGAITLEASGGGTYSWSTGETGNPIVVVPQDPTDYTVIITNGSCSETLTLSAIPSENYIDFELPEVTFTTPNEPIILVGPANYDSYTWSPGDQLNDTTGQLTTFSGTETQTILLSALHPLGCTIIKSTVVVVVDLDAPNGFSPNGDGINDFFVVPELDSIQGKLVVWNRWGDIVYQSDYYQNDWNGTCLGPMCLGEERLPEGTYFFQIDVKGITQEGYVTLKR
jgi:gliding motility-associated-like protein